MINKGPFTHIELNPCSPCLTICRRHVALVSFFFTSEGLHTHSIKSTDFPHRQLIHESFKLSLPSLKHCLATLFYLYHAQWAQASKAVLGIAGTNKIPINWPLCFQVSIFYVHSFFLPKVQAAFVCQGRGFKSHHFRGIIKSSIVNIKAS